MLDIPAKKLHFLFVCMGNTCRSPMAAAYCNAKYNRDDEPVRISASSAGLYGEGSPINPKAVSALHSVGVLSDNTNDYERHLSHTVVREDIESVDAVICMDRQIAAVIENLFPYAADKILSFPFPVLDPYGGDEQTYRDCLADIAAQIDGMLSFNGKNGDVE